MYKYCGQCGNQAQQGALYCVKCGAIIGNTVPRVNFTPPQAPFIPPTNSVNTSMSERRTATFSIQDIHSLCVSCKVFNIEILRSKGEEIEITWDETGSWSLSTEKVNSCLRLDEENYLGFQNFADFFSPQQHKSLSIALPTGYVGPLCLENETGCISIVGIIVEGKVEAKSTVGHIGVKNLKTNAGLHVEAHAGGIDILHVEADEEICVSSNIGQILLNSVHADKIDVNVSATGVVDCKRISAETSIAINAASGEVRCDIDDEVDNYTIHCHTIHGSCNLPHTSGNGPKTFHASANIGNIYVQFDKAEAERS